MIQFIGIGGLLIEILNTVNPPSTSSGVYREHVFAVVAWLTEHSKQYEYGKPIEIWDHSKYFQDGPATFLPVHKIACRCVVGYGTIKKPSGAEEDVMFVNSVPSFEFY